MANIYTTVVAEFEKQNCKLLTSEAEHQKILIETKKGNYRLNYVASCGHEHIVFFNVFKSRGTGIVCPQCKNKQIGEEKKQKMNTNEISKTITTEQEHNFIVKFQERVCNDFEIIKAFDGCNVDIIFKPKTITTDEWVGIQVKTTNVRHLTYSFHLHNTYNNCLLLFYCCEDDSMWLIPENTVANQKKVSIGYNKSKYNIYKATSETLITKLHELYLTTSKFSFETLDTPTNIYQHREQQFRKYREEKVNFIQFDYGNMEGTVYDFKIGNLKIQEKVTKISDDRKCCFQLCKNNGLINGKRNQIQYDIGDNDYYWLNCENKIHFFVIPEHVLIERAMVGNKKTTTLFKITVNEQLHRKSNWLQPYLFNYEQIDKERLLQVLRKTNNNLARGPKPMRPISATGPVDCCMCDETGRRDNMLVPSACLTKHGELAHRICQHCWWNKFAVEGAPHHCPGCVKQLPLTAPLKRTKPREEDIIVISDD